MESHRLRIKCHLNSAWRCVIKSSTRCPSIDAQILNAYRFLPPETLTGCLVVLWMGWAASQCILGQQHLIISVSIIEFAYILLHLINTLLVCQATERVSSNTRKYTLKVYIVSILPRCRIFRQLKLYDLIQYIECMTRGWSNIWTGLHLFCVWEWLLIWKRWWDHVHALT